MKTPSGGGGGGSRLNGRAEVRVSAPLVALVDVVVVHSPLKLKRASS